VEAVHTGVEELEFGRGAKHPELLCAPHVVTDVGGDAHARRVLAGLVVVLVCAAVPALGVALPGGPASLGKGWGRVVASGTLVGVDPTHHTVTLRVARMGQLDTFEGGTVWHRAAFTGTHVVRLLPETLVLDAGAHVIPLASVRPGEPAMLWAVARPDGAVLGLTLEMASPQVRAGRGAIVGTPSRPGVVLRRSASVLDLLSSNGGRRSVVMTAATVVQASARAVPASALGPYDVVQIDGSINSDGSVVATRIDVEFFATSAAQVLGPIEQSVSGLGGVVIADTMVSTSADTYVIRHNARVDLAGVAEGRPVTVYGIPVLDGTIPIGLAARIIAVR
jgi:hypothetical protein